MGLKEILDDFKSELLNAKEDMHTASELLILADDIGTSTVADKAKLRELDNQFDRYLKALDKRIKANGSK